MWKGHRLMPATEDELDDALVEWTEQCMADDPRRGPLQDCARARQYIMLWDPKQKLGYMKNAIKGWDRLVPGKRRVPIPVGLHLLMVRWCLLDGDLETATLIAMGFEYMMRPPSELLKRKMKDVHLPGSTEAWTGTTKGSLTLHRTKKKLHDSVTLEPSLATELLVRWHRVRCKQVKRTHRRDQRPDAPLFPISTQSFLRRWHRCLRELGLPDDHPFVPYSLRHGGTTHMHLQGEGTERITTKGRWDDEKTCNRYISSGNVFINSYKLPRRLEKKAIKLRKDPMSLLRYV
jgi:integrase